jgi:hypothetical protein
MLPALCLATLLLASPDRPVPLAFKDLLEFKQDGTLALSAKLQSLAGKRVEIVGHMADMERLPRGSFFLVPHPLVADESGAGSADLPPDAIRVIVRSAKGKALAQIPRPLRVIGVLEVGPKDEPDGLPSLIRIFLDPPPTRRSQKANR